MWVLSSSANMQSTNELQVIELGQLAMLVYSYQISPKALPSRKGLSVLS